MKKNEKIDWQKLVRRLELLMRLKSFPVAFKMLTDKTQLEKISFVRRPRQKATLCQLISQVRNFDWTVGADLDDFLLPTCPSIIGLTETPATHKDGTFRSIVWTATKADAKKFEASIPRLPLDKYKAVVMAPLVYNPFDPDIVLIYANPAQIMLLINSLQFEKYETMEFFCVGESSCSDVIARCYNTGKPSLSIPCYGERRYGHAQDDELVMAIPAGMMEKALRGMEALYRRGVRYPISFAGTEASMVETFPPSYINLDDMMAKVHGEGGHMVVGVTGSIACGKTAVTDMLEKKGARLIDFDLIARQVVEPGTPAFGQIVDYFGKQVLGEDGTLDRKKMSKIVFGDMEKRKKLESFTHPPIYEEFFRQIREITKEEPNAIIQVAVPLLIELNLQFLFDQLIVVYLSADEQVRRLALRDGISEKEASIIIASQLKPDDKTPFATFIVRNDGTLDDTEIQVGQIWKKLKNLQQNKGS